MAGLEPLLPLLYHEKQQSGSMLCAQHALNSLLQGNYFSTTDLSEIAQNLDILEGSYSNNPNMTSENMDDSGFFSVQVLENALSVWGLSLIRWRGEQMRPYQDHPEDERAFIFNQQQHWYTLRRFGPSESFENTVSGHWFNLNSSIPEPEWVSKLYLSMFIHAAEADGYSVFVVRPTDPEAPLALPKTEADDVAATLPEPSGTRADSRSMPDDMGGFDGADEDLELQMALQASLGHDIPPPPPPPPSDPPQLIRTSIPLPRVDSFPSSASGSRARTPSQRIDSPLSPDTPDPAASMAQSRRIYERMLAEQAEAHRELATVAGIDPRRRQQEEEEEEMLRQAIAESEELARLEGHGRPDDDDEADDMDVDQSQTARPPNLMGARVYDDEDEELQAALRASLEHMPEGWTPPAETSVPAVPPNTAIPINRSASLDSIDDDESIASEDTTTMESSEAPAEPVDVDEMRKRRLARFGG
ncbi:Josephin-domain-containing protein [Rhodocollybia butyracea]|uniref:ubiquitinyl hydrolase 1 n=1 Tax=Rhodocollybia butyracea TaxID=206335 RepID=A0A9P5PXI6_9AGAR|nr:Josephin-domain-containing protein [Rhodocollybia butyracea]